MTTNPYGPPVNGVCADGGTLLSYGDLNIFVDKRCRDQLTQLYPNVPTRDSTEQKACLRAVGQGSMGNCSEEDLSTYCYPIGPALSNLKTCTQPCRRFTGIPGFGDCSKQQSGENLPKSQQCSYTSTNWFHVGLPGDNNVCYGTPPNSTTNDKCFAYLSQPIFNTDIIQEGGVSWQDEAKQVYPNVSNKTLRNMCIEWYAWNFNWVDDQGFKEACPKDDSHQREAEWIKEYCNSIPESPCEPGGQIETVMWPYCYQIDEKQPNKGCSNKFNKTDCEKINGCDWGSNTNMSCANRVPDVLSARECSQKLTQSECMSDTKCNWQIKPPVQGYTCWYNDRKSPPVPPAKETCIGGYSSDGSSSIEPVKPTDIFYASDMAFKPVNLLADPTRNTQEKCEDCNCTCPEGWTYEYNVSDPDSPNLPANSLYRCIQPLRLYPRWNVALDQDGNEIDLLHSPDPTRNTQEKCDDCLPKCPTGNTYEYNYGEGKVTSGPDKGHERYSLYRCHPPTNSK